ncbi:hypothetical protein V6N13_098665 [Hibiscus sabdariffa]
MVEMLGITYTMKVYREVSVNPFEVKCLANDADVLEMVSNLPRNHYVHVYLEDVASLANSASVEPEIDVQPETTIDEDLVNDTDHVEPVDRVDDSGMWRVVRFDSDPDSEHSDSLHSLDGSNSDGPHRKYRYPEFNTTVDISNPTFKVELIFATKRVLKEAVKMYNIKNMVVVRLKRNENRRIQVFCKEGCPWLLWVSPVDFKQHYGTWQVKSLSDELRCLKDHQNSNITSKFIVE